MELKIVFDGKNWAAQGPEDIRFVGKSHEPRKKPSYFPLYWLVNRDPYNGLL